MSSGDGLQNMLRECSPALQKCNLPGYGARSCSCNWHRDPTRIDQEIEYHTLCLELARLIKAMVEGAIAHEVFDAQAAGVGARIAELARLHEVVASSPYLSR